MRPMSVGRLQRSVKWVRVYCEGQGCGHCSAMALAPLVIRWGPDVSGDKLRCFARCTKCGRKGAALQVPLWCDAVLGVEPFPVNEIAPVVDNWEAHGLSQKVVS